MIWSRKSIFKNKSNNYNHETMPRLKCGPEGETLYPESGGSGFTPVFQLYVLALIGPHGHMLPSLLHGWEG